MNHQPVKSGCASDRIRNSRATPEWIEIDLRSCHARSCGGFRVVVIWLSNLGRIHRLDCLEGVATQCNQRSFLPTNSFYLFLSDAAERLANGALEATPRPRLGGKRLRLSLG